MGVRLIAVLLVAVLEQVSADLTIGTYNYLVDPGRIFTWRQKWMASQIELSKSNQGATGVDVTFYVNPSTGISNGIFEVTFPAGFDLKSVADSQTASVSGQVVQLTQSFPSDTDLRITIPRVTNPSNPGAYGPFALRTRLHATGQIIDTNLSFGTVYISATEGKLSSLIVAYASGSVGVINRSGNTLSFKLTLSKSMWAHDIFKITVPWQFTVINPDCRSIDQAGKWNNYNGTATDVHYLDCMATDKVAGVSQVVYIYGLSTNADLYLMDDNRNLELTITGFKNPDRVYPETAYVWTVDTIRFNTHSVLESGSANGPKTVAGDLTAATWTPTWGRLTTSILRNQKIYMDMAITLANPLPAGGSLEVTHSGKTEAWGGTSCYLVTNTSPKATCVVDTTQKTIVAGLEAIPIGGVLVVRHYINFGEAETANQILTVTSKSSEGYEVDKGASLAGFKFPATTDANPITLDAAIRMIDGTLSNKAGGPGSGDYYLMLKMTGITGFLTSATVITFSCPVSSEATDNQFFFSGATGMYKTGANSIDFTSGSPVNLAVRTKTTDADTSVTITPGSMTIAANGLTTYKPGTLSFKAVEGMIASELTVGLHAPTPPNFMVVPSIVDNPATAYECAVDFTTAGSTTVKPSSGLSRFVIDYQDFDSASSGVTYFCKRGNLAGSPIKISFLPKAMSIRPDDGAKTFYVDIEMPSTVFSPPGKDGTFYGSGVKEGGVYPMDSNISGSPSMTVLTVGGSIVHRLKGLGLISPVGSAVDIYFPVAGAKGNLEADSIKLKSFFMLSTDQRLKYYSHSGTINKSYDIDTSAASNGGGFHDSTAPGSQVNGNKLDLINVDFKLQLSSSVLQETYFYVVLPKGYSFSSFRDVLVYTDSATNQVSFPWKKYFSSPSLAFQFPGVLLRETATGARISSQSLSTISFRGLNLPIGATEKDATFVHANVNGDLKAACLNSGTLKIKLTQGNIKSITVSPQTVYARGPGGVDTTYSLIFSLPHGIDQDGSIKLSVAAGWATTTWTVCSVAGLSNISNTQTVACTYTGNDFTIKNFADFNTVTNTKVTILLTHMLSPKNESATKASEVSQFVSTLKSYTSDGLEIDFYDTADTTINGSTKVTVLYPLTVGTTNYQTKLIFPPNANVGPAEMYLKVSFPYDLPSGSDITVSPPYTPNTATDLKESRERCHLSPLRYKTCAITATSFVVTLGEDYRANTALEVFVHQGLVAPAEVPASTAPVGFKIVTSWASVKITEDTVLSQFVVQPKLSSTIIIGTAPIDFYPRNAYESATYKFTFTSSVAFKLTDRFIILWPTDFDPYLSVAEQSYKTETGAFYVPCSSDKIGTAYCVMDQWMMIVQGTAELEASKEFSITVTGVRNPPKGTTSSFMIWHMRQNELMAFNTNIGKITTGDLPKELDIRSVSVSVHRIASTADYDFKFYTSDSIGVATELWFTFPPEISLSLLTTQTEFPCSATYSDQSSATGKADQTWVSSSNCKLRGAETVVLPGGNTAVTFTTSQEIHVKLSNVPTPEWGLERYALSSAWDFDVQDDTVWTIYSRWTSQFKIFVYQSDANTRSYASRPYAQQNFAYLGFLQPLRKFVVNSYNPQNRANRIIVYPGTQSSDIPITTANSSWPLESKHVTFAAKVNPNTPDGGALSFSSLHHNFVMLQDEWSINFRVAATANALKGLYFITWSLTEGKQPTVTDAWYTPPPQTLVEVPAYKEKVYAFAFDDIPVVPVGTTSLPVRVWVTNAPHTDVELNIEVPAPFNNTISVSPAILKFVPNLNSLYFNITVASNHDYEGIPRVNLAVKLAGTNAAQYSVAPAFTVRINRAYYPTKGRIATIGVSDITKTSFTLSPSTDQIGIVYYAVSPRGSKISSFAELKALMPNFEYTVDQLAIDATSYTDARTASVAESDPPEGVAWNDYQHQLFSRHMTSFFSYGAIMMRTTTSDKTVTIPGLWADSVYQIVAYLDNLKLNGTVSDQYLKYVWTQPTADYQPLSLSFAGDVAAAHIDNIKNVLAKHVGVNPSRLQNQSITVKYPATRLLQDGNTTVPPVTPPVQTAESTTFQFLLVANRSLNWPTPTLEATLSNERSNDLRVELKTLTSYLGSVSQIVYTLPAIPTRVTPSWRTPAQLLSWTNSSATVQYRSSVRGTVCCAALPDSQAIVIPDQVVEGYSYNWTKVPSACAPAYLNETVDTLDLQNLQADTVYSIQCIAMDDTPLWPTLMSYTSANSIPFVSFHSPLTNDLEIIANAGIVMKAVAILWLLSA